MTGPYGEAWETYRRAGWTGVLPLPPRRKQYPPRGFTGEDGVYPSYADGMTWAEGPEAAGNVALRLPHGVLGIDVDAYDGKPGAATLAAAEHRWGPLPPTWRSSSRNDGASAIRFYRIPEGLAWPGELGPGVELIQYRHRYAVVWPSIHPSGAVYRWTTPQGVTSAAVPDIEALPWLPQAWVQGLTGGREHTPAPRNDWDDTQIREWILARPRGAEPPCERTRRAVDDALFALHAGTSAHGAVMSALMRVVRLADEHHAGLLPALAELHGAFIADVTRTDRPGASRSRREAEAEWARGLRGAVQKVSAAPTGVDGCDCGGRLLAALAGRVGSAPADESEEDEDGDGERDDFAGVWQAPPAAPPDPAAPGPDAFFEQQVASEMLRIRVREEAARRVRKARRGSAPPPAITPLEVFLAAPDEPARYRVEGLWPVGGRVMLTAQFKAGKTTMVGNLVRSLADGEPFLGRFGVDPPAGRTIVIDDELDERMLRRWLRDQGVGHPERAAVLPLRGRVSTFDLLDEQTRQEWAEALRGAGASIVILDCLAPVLDSLGLSEDKEAGRFLVAFDELLKESGAEEAVIIHHMGHSGERARGASRLRDWPDVEWRLVRDKEDGEDNPAARRYFSAYGRDVDIPESALSYEPLMRRLVLAGGSRKQAATDEAADAIVEFLTAEPWASKQRIEIALAGDFARAKIRAALQQAVDDGRVTTRIGPRAAVLHAAATSPPTSPPILKKNWSSDVSAGQPTSPTSPPEIGLDATSNNRPRRPRGEVKPQVNTHPRRPRRDLASEVGATSPARPPKGGWRAAGESPRADPGGEVDERDVTDLLAPERTWLDPSSGDLIDTRTGEVLNATGGAQ